METIILAGGFGTRLQSKVPNIPKPMAIINDRPFLDYLLSYLMRNQISRIIFSLFYKNEIIKNYYSNRYNSLDIAYSVDKKALGTGGAIRNALSFALNENAFVINGDTYFNIDLKMLFEEHLSKKNDITISLKKMKNFDRYGIVTTNNNGDVLSIKEKQYCKNGVIDGGIYLIKKNLFDSFEVKDSFAFSDFIMQNIDDLKVGSVNFDDDFIDIGTPDDYDKAKNTMADYL